MWFRIKRGLKKCKIFAPFINFRKKQQDKKLIKITHKYGYDINTIINEILGEKFEYYAWSGTLLGVVRENAFIKYDNDMDYGITITDESVWKELYKIMVGKGFSYHHHFEKDGKITEIAFRYKGVHVDFFGIYKNENQGKYWFGARLNDIDYNDNEFTPVEVEFDYSMGIIKKDIKNTKFNIPNFYHEILVANYGKNYMTPIKNVGVETECGKRNFLTNEKMLYSKDIIKFGEKKWEEL